MEEKKDSELLPAALEAAKRAKKVVIFAGLPDSYESEGYDRSHMKLPQNQDKLIEEIVKVNDNVAVVLHNGSPVEMPWIGKVNAVLESYLAGESVGMAQFDLLFGKANPCGKLAESFPVKLSDNPSYFNFPGNGIDVNYAEGLFVGYRYYDKKEMEVLFPFGHGLSYTSYEYSDLKLSSSKILDTDTLEVSVKVTNTGKMAGKEIVQLYVSEKTGTREIRPVKELKGFMKVHLEPGESKTVKFSLDKRSFAFYNTDIHDWYAPTGEYEILIGASSKDIRLTAGLELTSTVKGVFVVGENTVLQEVMEHPVASKIARPLIDAYLKGQNDGERSETAKSTVSDEMIWAMMCSMPLRALRSFAQMSDEEVAQFIAKINEELMK